MSRAVPPSGARGARTPETPPAEPRSSWAARLERAEARYAASLREVDGIEAALTVDELWLRGETLEAGLERALRRVPGLARFERDARVRLIPIGRRVPVATLPELEWTSLRDLYSLDAPRLALPAEPPEPVTLSLVRTARARPATALLVPLESLDSWCDSAAEARTEGLRYVADSSGRALVLGDPLPPIPGRPYWAHGDVLLPCGFEVDPPLCASSARRVLSAALEIEAEDHVLFDEDGPARLAADAWVSVSRASVRATRAAWESGR